jgi:hypothetical protein
MVVDNGGDFLKNKVIEMVFSRYIGRSLNQKNQRLIVIAGFLLYPFDSC